MKKPTIPKIKAANPVFFADNNVRFHGDQSYELHGHRLTVNYQRETSDRRIVNESHDYAVNPNTLELTSISKQHKTGRPYIFVQPDKSGPCMTQWLNDDGTPQGEPDPAFPNHPEPRS